MRKYFALMFVGVMSAGGLWAQTNPCTVANYVLSGSSELGTRNSFGYEGGVTRAALQVPNGCTWQITNAPAWVTIISPSTGTNTTIVVLGVETNTATTGRSGIVTIAGKTFPITQAAAPAGCAFTLQSPSANVPANGTVAGNRVNSTMPSCQWVSFSNRNWLQLYPIGGAGTTDFTYTVFPNFSTGQRTAIGSAGGQDLSIVQTAATGAYNERLVRLLYFNFLGRLPAANEVAFHVQNLNNGMLPVDLAINFMNTQEFNIVGRFIAGLYVGILVRDAEFSGWLFQRNAVSTGVAPLGSLVTNFLSSAEYANKFGNPADAQFVGLLYKYILGRTPSNSEVQTQVNALNGGTSRTQLTTSFLNSAEFRNGRGAQLTAFILYATLLSRDPSPIELPTRIQQIQSAPNADAMIRTLTQEIMNSTEFTQGLN